MAPAADDDDARHRQEEAERRAKRKAAKSSKSDAQKEKDRKRKEHAQRVLQQQQGSSAKRSKTGPSPPTTKPPPPPSSTAPETSQFEQLFAQRAQGFFIDFKFANAPPRPPVGPCFVGLGLDGHLLERTTFKPYALAEDFVWKLHSEPDLGVPLARWAMDIHSYEGGKDVAAQAKHYVLHPDDVELLEWKGSLGDTAAEQLKQRREQARVAARLVSEGKAPNKMAAAAAASNFSSRKTNVKDKSRKSFSRVLPENMQSWMKKTTYMANDYSRKVHDFKSLAQTKQQVVEDLEVKQIEIAKRKSSMAITKMFDTVQMSLTPNALPSLQHPTNAKLKAVKIMPLLPNVEHWGYAYTHVVMDKAPTLRKQRQRQVDNIDLDHAMIAHVEKRSANSRMSCQLVVPQPDQKTKAPSTHIEDDDDDDDEAAKKQQTRFTCIQEYDLDVIPLKEFEDAPSAHYCLWVDPQNGIATYLPIPSRVQLSVGRPPQNASLRDTVVSRRPPGDDWADVEERRAEVDYDMAVKYKRSSNIRSTTTNATSTRESNNNKSTPSLFHDEDDDDDDDDDDDAGFGNSTSTIVAEG